MKTLKLAKDSKNKWNIIDVITGRVVTGHFSTRMSALDVMKNWKEKPITEPEIKNPLPRRNQIQMARAKKLGISLGQYITKFC